MTSFDIVNVYRYLGIIAIVVVLSLNRKKKFKTVIIKRPQSMYVPVQQLVR